MPGESLQSVVQHLHRLIDVGPGAASDAVLLDRFANSRDESAFALLVWRYGPLVLAVCRRVLQHEHDSEDVFQATFLTLARKANSINKKDTLASWLYKVAFRIACRVRAKSPPLTNQTAKLAAKPAADADAEIVWRDLRGVLDQEVARLPAAYSQPIILCYLEGKTHEQAAELLGWPKGTVASRLARGRDRLRQRLLRRGWTLSAGVLATVLAEKAAAAAIPGELVRSTVQAATAYVAGAAAGVLSAKAVLLTEGVLQMMWYSKLKTALVALLAVIVTSAGVGWVMHRAVAGSGTEGTQAEHKPKVEPPSDSKADIAAMRAEIAKLRTELDAAMKEIKSLKEGRIVPQEDRPFYQGKSVRFWLQQMNDADPQTRAEAVKAIGFLARKKKDLIPVLVEAIKRDGPYEAKLAAEALAALGEETMPILLDLLRDQDSPAVQAHAAEAIGRMGQKAKPAIPALAAAVKGKNLGLCRASLEALARIGPNAKDAVPAILETLESSFQDIDIYVRERGKNGIKTSRFGVESPAINVMVIYTLARIDPDWDGPFGRGGGGRPAGISRNRFLWDDDRSSRRDQLEAAWREELQKLKKHFAKQP